MPSASACSPSAGHRHGHKLYLLVLVALTTGARKGELLALRWADIDRERAVAYVRASKNGDRRMLPLTPAVLEELKRFGGAEHALLFGSERRPGKPMQFDAAWQLALKEARIDNFRFHDLRHSCASYLAQQGASLVELADVLGPSNDEDGDALFPSIERVEGAARQPGARGSSMTVQQADNDLRGGGRGHHARRA